MADAAVIGPDDVVLLVAFGFELEPASDAAASAAADPS
jgi:hypothetical protein